MDNRARKCEQRDRFQNTDKQYEHVVKNAQEPVFIVLGDNISICNSHVSSLLGYSREELVRTPVINLVWPEDRQIVEDRFKHISNGDMPAPHFSIRLKNKTGYPIWVRVTSLVIPWKGAEGVLYFLTDLTPQQELVDHLQHAQKMEMVGTLTGGIAHDFNNLLMAIQGIISIMLFNTDPSHPHYEYLRHIEKQARNGARLSAQLLGFTRKGKYEVESINMNQLVAETAKVLSWTRKEIVLQYEFAEDVSTVEGDWGQLEQLLLNILINAADAMPDGGCLTLKTRNLTNEDIRSSTYNPKPGQYVQLVATDTGTGIDKETQKHIFEPFFTTKKTGRGTGLGLASCYGIVKAHGGYIEVESEVGKGTSFYVYLPSTRKGVQQSLKACDQIVKGSGTILLVNDENGTLDIGTHMLQMLGYTVITVNRGWEAITSYKRHINEIDLVILDTAMPNIKSKEVYYQLKDINPDIKILLSSGYGQNEQTIALLSRACNGFIQKPYSMNELSQKVTELIA